MTPGYFNDRAAPGRTVHFRNVMRKPPRLSTNTYVAFDGDYEAVAAYERSKP